MIDQSEIDSVFGGHLHEPTTMYMADDDVVKLGPYGVRIPRKCKCGATVFMKNKCVGGTNYMGWFE